MNESTIKFGYLANHEFSPDAKWQIIFHTPEGKDYNRKTLDNERSEAYLKLFAASTIKHNQNIASATIDRW
jgi:hypothetical protein